MEVTKRVLNLDDVPPHHSGVVVYDVFYNCLQEWVIERKVCWVFKACARRVNSTFEGFFKILEQWMENQLG